jgi:hypothetical protein
MEAKGFDPFILEDAANLTPPLHSNGNPLGQAKLQCRFFQNSIASTVNTEISQLALVIWLLSFLPYPLEWITDSCYLHQNFRANRS